MPSANVTPSVAVHPGLDDVAAINQMADLGLTDAGRGQISLDYNSNRMFDMRDASYGLHLADRAGLSSATGWMNRFGSKPTLAAGALATKRTPAKRSAFTNAPMPPSDINPKDASI